MERSSDLSTVIRLNAVKFELVLSIADIEKRSDMRKASISLVHEFCRRLSHDICASVVRIFMCRELVTNWSRRF